MKRQVAQCEMEAERIHPNAHDGNDYLYKLVTVATCMRAAGFVTDYYSEQCKLSQTQEYSQPQLSPACYKWGGF